MMRLRRILLWTFLPLLLGFLVLWSLGPVPVAMGPYVQNCTATAAEICCFDEVASKVVVELIARSAAPTILREEAPARAHRVRAAGLRPDTRYRYRILAEDGVTPRFEGSFKTAPEAADASFSFAVVGDSGDVPNWFKLRRFGFGRLRGLLQHLERTGQWDVGGWMAAQQPDFFVHVGDIIYSHDQLAAYDEAFFRPFAGVLTRGALFTTFGNHDMHTWEHPEYFEVFHTPKPLDPAQGFRDFSHTFTWGGVRFVVLDAFWQDWADDSSARAWLVETLRTNRLPRTVVVIHNPPFSDEAGVAPEPNVVARRIWPLLVEHRVHLVVCGNDHNYQRFKPIDGIQVVTAGTGGKSIRKLAPTARLAHHEERFGFLLVKVTGTRIAGEFWTGGTTPADAFVVVE